MNSKLGANQSSPTSEKLADWVNCGLPPAQGGVLKVTFQNSKGESKTLKAIPCACTPEKFQGALFDTDVLGARMSITQLSDPLQPVVLNVEPEDTAVANEYYSTNEYPFSNSVDIKNFFEAFCKAIEEQIQL